MEKRRRNYDSLINCCYDTITDMCRVVDFFKEQRKLFEPFYLMFSEIRKFNSTYYDDLNEVHASGSREVQSKDVSSFKKLLERVRDDLINGKKPEDSVLIDMAALIAEL